MNKLKLLLLVLPFLWNSACTNTNEVTEQLGTTVYFQFEYVNHAWGYAHQGFIIDQAGNIYEYSQPENWNWPSEDKISRDLFNANLKKAEVRLAEIKLNELRQMEIKALSAKNGSLSEAKHVMADAGVESYAIYLTDEDSGELTRYLLQNRGDFYQKNTSKASDEIVSWLITIRGEEGYTDEHFE